MDLVDLEDLEGDFKSSRQYVDVDICGWGWMVPGDYISGEVRWKGVRLRVG